MIPLEPDLDWQIWSDWVHKYSKEYITFCEVCDAHPVSNYEYELGKDGWIPPPPPPREEGYKCLTSWVKTYANAWIQDQREQEEEEERTVVPATKGPKEWWCRHHYENKKEKMNIIKTN